MTHSRTVTLVALLALLGWVGACADAPPDGAEPAGADAASERLGPHDGRDLPPFALDRVQVGDTAPDFTLASYEGGPVTLSDFRGEKKVVLVFYRGHW